MSLGYRCPRLVAKKVAAQYIYKCKIGYMPMVGHLAETGLIIHDDFHEGNVVPSADKLAFIKACEAQLPQDHAVVVVRADSAAYQAGIINSAVWTITGQCGVLSLGCLGLQCI